ncbi:hypothetical protein PIB30_074806 [Stylosanthes scabra]|uniref:Uncharacterized protein n=1 Tax=Stylosanthes scabra TaxID=79078 RepID=A0ABU6TSS3_9FABA|nr:hypothetical protein [Stylosanthes scabra]
MHQTRDWVPGQAKNQAFGNFGPTSEEKGKFGLSTAQRRGDEEERRQASSRDGGTTTMNERFELFCLERNRNKRKSHSDKCVIEDEIQCESSSGKATSYCEGFSAPVSEGALSEEGDGSDGHSPESDFWFVFEAEEYLRHFGYENQDIAALWYKSPAENVLETALNQFVNDRDALEMGADDAVGDEVGSGDANGGVVGAAEEEVGNVEAAALAEGGVGKEGPAMADEEDEVIGDPCGVAEKVNVEQDVALEEVDANVNLDEGEHEVSSDEAAEGGVSVNASVASEVEAYSDKEDNNEESEYVPSEENTDSADDVQFTDSEKEFDLDVGGFDIGHASRASGYGVGDRGKKF